ncbi:MAG: hypothetical protein M3Y51_03120 [Actinomycetota bacterium]|nr:hypothetical protein [Actinomycetota bacterium]
MRPSVGADRRRNGGLLAYLILLLSLQAFLLVVALEGVLAHEPGLARAAAALSVVVAAAAFGLRWFIRHD